MKFIEKQFKIDLHGLLEKIFEARHAQDCRMAAIFAKHTGSAPPAWMTQKPRNIEMLHSFIKDQRILGGFARQLARGRKKDRLLRYFKSGGDIDCFYDTEEAANEAASYFAHRGFSPTDSVTGICKNYGGYTTGIKVQMVQLISGSTEELFETFDLVNSMFEARFSRSGNTVYVRAPQVAWDAEKNKKIIVARNNTPLLIPRVWKYHIMQNLKIDHQVEEALGQNIYGLLGPIESWDNPMMEYWKKSKETIEICRERISILPVGHLPLFVGRWKERRKDHPYGPSYVVDLAIEEIQSRKQ